jgi:hypothetical protein
VQRHAAFAVPFGPGDFRAAETAAAVDPDALRAHAHGVLHRPLHGAAESNAALQLLGDDCRNQVRVDLRLAHFNDVEVHSLSVISPASCAQLLDVRALLADDHTRTRGVDRHAALLVRALDDDLRNAGLLAVLS